MILPSHAYTKDSRMGANSTNSNICLKKYKNYLKIFFLYKIRMKTMLATIKYTPKE